MVQIGQCPSCRTVYQIEPDAIGQTIDCECEATLFVSNAHGFSEIPVACTTCDGEYVVDRSGAGESVECKCGSQLTVPSFVLCTPLVHSAQEASAIALKAKGNDKKLAVNAVACPRCDRQYETNHEDVSEIAVCKCGCRFEVTFADQAFVANEVDPPKQTSPATDPRPKKPMSLLSILGVAAVGLFLLVSIIMFATSGDNDKTDSGAEDNSVATVADSVPELTTENLGSLAEFATGNTELAITPIPDPGSELASTTDADKRFRATILLPPKESPIPKPQDPPKRVPVIAAKVTGMTLDRAFETAFEAYQAAKQPDATEQQIGEAIGWLQAASTMILTGDQQQQDRINELRYMLAFMYHRGGHLIEASIVGESVAKSGKKNEASTLEAALIALSAAQRANDVQWGNAEQVGELDRMHSIASVIATRWPANKNLDAIWLDLGQRYQSFFKRQKAGDCFARVSEKSQQYAESRVAAGSVLWDAYRVEVQSGAEPAALLVQSKKLFGDGVKALSATGKPSLPYIAAKLTLARIEILEGNFKAAEAWLVDDPVSVTNSISNQKASDGKIKVPPSLYQSVFETLFLIKSERSDLSGAMLALKKMTAGSDGDSKFGRMVLGLVKLKIKELTASSAVTREQFSELSELIEPLESHADSLTATNLLWLGESWGKLAQNAANPTLTKQGFDKAAAAFEMAMGQPDFPSGSTLSATLRRAQFLRGAGRLSDAIPLLQSVLAKTPNAFGLQIEAAEAVQQTAIDSDRAKDLYLAINGTEDESIWGWAKLVSVLHQAESTVDNRDRVLMCQYNLMKCRWMLAEAAPSDEAKEEQLASVRKQLGRILATTSSNRQPWYTRLQELAAAAAP